MREVDNIDGVTITEWDDRPADRRYTVLHPKCGVNIQPSETQDQAETKARRHARKCRG